MAVTKAVTFGIGAESDVITLPADAFKASVMVKGSVGTPAAGDTLDIRLLYSTGDTDSDPDTADEYTTIYNAPVADQLDVSQPGPLGENPAYSNALPIDTAAKNLKVHVFNNATSNTFTVSSQISYQQSDGTRAQLQVQWS